MSIREPDAVDALIDGQPRGTIECPYCGGEGGFDDCGEDICTLCNGAGMICESWNDPAQPENVPASIATAKR